MGKWALLCFGLVILGLIDCATTVAGTTLFGATEMNPVLAPVVATGPFVFSAIKLVFVALIGGIFYKAGRTEMVPGAKLAFGGRFLQLAYSMSFLTLATVVTNNIIVVAKLI